MSRQGRDLRSTSAVELRLNVAKSQAESSGKCPVTKSYYTTEQEFVKVNVSGLFTRGWRGKETLEVLTLEGWETGSDPAFCLEEAYSQE